MRLDRMYVPLGRDVAVDRGVRPVDGNAGTTSARPLQPRRRAAVTVEQLLALATASTTTEDVPQEAHTRGAAVRSTLDD
jgi:hypothetical protein